MVETVLIVREGQNLLLLDKSMMDFIHDAQTGLNSVVLRSHFRSLVTIIILY